jgi:hypothetical protein
LTLKEESVIYATSSYQAKARNSLLFNNLSDNLCGHSQDDISHSGGKKYQVLKSDQAVIHLVELLRTFSFAKVSF